MLEVQRCIGIEMLFEVAGLAFLGDAGIVGVLLQALVKLYST